jgi:5-methylcytosine-specific restriction endonuclease McrA
LAKPIEDFQRHGLHRAGQCKPCVSDWGKQYRTANTEKIKQYRRSHPRKRIYDPVKAKEYQLKYREKRLIAAKKYYLKNRDRIKKWREVNKERLRQKVKEVYALRHGEKRRAYAKQYQKANPEKLRARLKKWAAKNSDYVKAKNAWWGAYYRNGLVGEKFSPLTIYKRDGGRCHICKKLVKKTDASLDHLIPISKGGEHTERNVALAHRRCNSSRGAGRIAAQLRLN